MKRCKWRAHAGPKNPNSKPKLRFQIFSLRFLKHRINVGLSKFQPGDSTRCVSFNMLSHTYSQRHHTWTYWRSMQEHNSNRFSKSVHEWTSLRRRSSYRSWDWIWQHGDISAFFTGLFNGRNYYWDVYLHHEVWQILIGWFCCVLFRL